MERRGVDYEVSLFLARNRRATIPIKMRRTGHRARAQYLSDSDDDIDVLRRFNKTALILALDNGDEAEIKRLLDDNADIYRVNYEGISPLQSVVDSYVCWSNSEGKHQIIIQMFLERVKKDYLNDLDTMATRLIDAYCPLHLVVKYIRIPEVTRKMLDAGRTADEFDASTKLSALHVAVEMTDLEHVKLLMGRGANIHIKDQQGRTMLDYYHPTDPDTDEALGILKILSERGVCLVPDGAKWPVIQNLLLYGKKQTIDVLLEHLNLFARNDRNDTPLHFLVCNVNPGVLETLSTKQFFVDACNDLGYTLLMTATKSGTASAVDFLLARGADVNAENPTGFTALFLAYSNTSLEADELMKMVNLLLRYGSNVQHELPDNRTILDVATNYTSLRPVLDHLAMMETAGHSFSAKIRDKINNNDILKNYYYGFAMKQFQKTKWSTRPQ